MKKALNEQDYWKLLALNQRLRAINGEEQLLQAQYANLQQQRIQAQASWREALKEAGEHLGATGNPEEWRVQLNPDDPTKSILEFPGGGDELVGKVQASPNSD